MSKDTYDIDAILAEFRDGGGAAEPPAEQSPRAQEASSEPSPVPAEKAAPQKSDVSFHTSTAEQPALSPEVSDAATVRFEPAVIDAPPREAPQKPAKRSLFKKADKADEAASAEKPAESRRLEKKKKAEKEPKVERAPRVYRKRRIPWILRALMCLVFMVFALGVIAWTGLNLHPASGTLSFSPADTKLRLSDKLDVYVNNAASDALGDLTYIRKIYTLQESDTVSPAPDPNCFGSTYDPNDVLEVIKSASVLLDGQDVTFYAGADFAVDEPIRWYCDDTILVIAWKEYIEGRYCNLAEVKIAHGSQLRRKLADDTFGSGVQYYASELARASNAVVASNADFYGFRDIGLTVYQRNLYRFNPDRLDICFFTSSGDMLFTRAGELTSPEQTEQFIKDNDVVFSLAFGPVLVDNGELQYCSGYPIGEVNTEYTRSCIGMTDDLHYLLMTVSWSPDGLSPHATVNDLSRTIYSKNVKKAYALDGGQTAEIVMMGEPFSRIDWNAERVVSDIIYFATAIPEEVRP